MITIILFDGFKPDVSAVLFTMVVVSVAGLTGPL